ncbi:hypothetical protein P9VFCI_213 [Rhizobium phage P9VFCI]|uniref:Uncharacterized protein n=2 Tax=Innesvirus TaxID=3044739 RepID=A0A6B9J1Y8_9CAUD|nr:hypothetical protein PP937_gp213 [Rhizobium phage P9VFCI]YP_010662936.1 hypothetical protein PP940_gp258 [Rhizobium phage RL2RES]QGZ14314.1 hypothetical protein RL2RES_258 [Rhizobium phage RL2RES]QNH71987.1 hypothetical protein P9VFCI_213 [Rhizobium phage P9VFCI]
MATVHTSSNYAFMSKDKKQYYQNNGSLTTRVCDAACFDKMAIDDLKSFLSFFDIDRDDVILVEVSIVVMEEDLPF